MLAPLTIRSAQPEDARQWLTLWRAYCAALGGAVSDTTTTGLWDRILGSDHPIGCLVACNFRTKLIGLANYVLHPHTWSLQLVCYLEDLYVTPEARGHGAGRLLIEGLVTLGRERSWRRIYWHTHDNNHAARALYDQLAPPTDYVRYDIDLSPVRL